MSGKNMRERIVSEREREDGKKLFCVIGFPLSPLARKSSENSAKYRKPAFRVRIKNIVLVSPRDSPCHEKRPVWASLLHHIFAWFTQGVRAFLSGGGTIFLPGSAIGRRLREKEKGRGRYAGWLQRGNKFRGILIYRERDGSQKSIPRQTGGETWDEGYLREESADIDPTISVLLKI